MSKLNSIQTGLQQIAPGTFQKLCDAYLYYKGLKVVTHGSTSGEDKTRPGTPDSFSLLQNGKYVFIQYTTQKTALIEKLLDDLNDCLDEGKTGIPNNLIEKVILCFNSKLDLSNTNIIIQKAVESELKVELIDLDILSFDIYQNYPKIAMDFLGIEIDTGQILLIDDFIKQYQKSSFATPLDNKFYFRDNELQKINDALRQQDLVILSGDPGVGKTKLALESADRFCKSNSDYTAYAISNKNFPDLFRDLKYYILPDRNYVIVIDDANRLQHFKFIIDLIYLSNTDYKVKLIVTVRGYALKSIKEVIYEVANKEFIDIEKFSPSEIEKLLQNEFGITNFEYIEKINQLTQGNARLAMMAGKLALESNNILSLYDISHLYDNYFRSIFNDLRDFENNNLIKVLAVVAFLRSIDKSNVSQIEKILSFLNISENDFWECVMKLREFETIDLFDSYIAKVSDQILAMYFFYLVFIKDKTLEYSVLLEKFTDDFRDEKLIEDSLIPIVNSFGYESVIQLLQGTVDTLFKKYRTNSDIFLNLLSVFWFIKPNETLIFINEELAKINSTDLSTFDFELEIKNRISNEPKIYNLLKKFVQFPDFFENSLELMFDFLRKYPDNWSLVLTYFEVHLMYDRKSYTYGYTLQFKFLSYLILKCENEKEGEFFRRLLLRLIPKYLVTSYQTTWTSEKMTMTIATMPIRLTKEMQELRRLLWEFINKGGHSQSAVHKAMKEYVENHEWHPQINILRYDEQFVTKIIETHLDPSDYNNCSIVKEYYRRLEIYGVTSDCKDLILTKFSHRFDKLIDLLNWDYVNIPDKLTIEQYDKNKDLELKKHFESFDFEAHKIFLNDFEYIKTNCDGLNTYDIFRSFETILVNLVSSNLNMLYQILEYICKNGNNSKFIPYVLFRKILAINEEYSSQIYNLINQTDFSEKESWKGLFFAFLDSKHISADYCNELVTFAKTVNLSRFIVFNFDFIFAYKLFKENVISEVLTIILERAKSEKISYNFTNLFMYYPERSEIISELLTNDIELLKSLYLFSANTNRSTDRESKILALIMKKDENFIFEYLKAKKSKKGYLADYDDSRDYKFIWEMDNYENILDRLIEYCSDNGFSIEHNYYNLFFKKFPFENKVSNYLNRYIDININDSEKINYVLDILRFNYPNEVNSFLKRIIEMKPEFEYFEQLDIEHIGYFAHGSPIPVFETKIKNLESLLGLFSELRFLRHKQYIEDRIKYWRQRIYNEERRNFLGSDWD